MSTNEQPNDQQDTRSPEEIEADIKSTRSHLDETLSDFQARFSSDSMMNTAMDYVKSDSAKEYFSNLSRSIKENPVPTAMIGLGIGWLIYSSNSSKSGSVPNHFDDKRQAQARHNAAATPPQTHEYDSAPSQRVGDGAPGAYAFGPDTAEPHSNQDGQSLRDRASSALGSAGDKANDARHGASDHMGRLKDSAGEQLHNASSKARDTGNWLSNLAEENPVCAGALGLAAGALLGSLIPSTRTEQKAMGDARDQVVDKATEAGSEQLERASDKAKAKAEEHTSSDDGHDQASRDAERTSSSASTPGSTPPSGTGSFN
ncbi:DUF3618 domain-containing protein [Larsenimonas salina]|uniref:DUF3618 domain-containing protein n=1 Tax=Larsenimonas salina TaxID=1295565 RepID=UPI00207480DA|nr:DUF3618 domain-containing protein [Larsenimonas salina]MCM5704535.1 DUF3618 domain-containing protein [Larsenimonas salina]